MFWPLLSDPTFSLVADEDQVAADFVSVGGFLRAPC